ncbi:MAG: DUF4157 domain-containing protein [Acidobacteriota bacterium]|nr:DUF4157 domain-containing protein [Acidobacteriota bacterium]
MKARATKRKNKTTARPAARGSGSFAPAPTGRKAIRQALESASIQAKLKVGRPDDAYEREADSVADEVMRMPDPTAQTAAGGAEPPPAGNKNQGPDGATLRRKPVTVSLRKGSAPVQRMCDECEQEVQRPEDKTGAAPKQSMDPEPLVNRVKSGGSPLAGDLRAFFEPRFDRDFSQVRIHTGSHAETATEAVSARAFTLGNNIVFGRGQYNPHTDTGKRLLAHELTHTIQQGDSHRVQGDWLQRQCSNDGVATNCHNWTIPLPPWIAGSIAHGQISALLGILPQAIPRATKLLMGMPNPPAITPYGFPDLWRTVPGFAEIAEIKSSYTGCEVAEDEAAHYVRRHDEWATRAPHTDQPDLNYAATCGGVFPGALMNLTGRTGTDLNLGIFWGDPGKQLHVQANAMGGMIYWCTGAGITGSPLWYPAFRQLARDLRDFLNQLRQTFQEILDGIIEAGETVAAAVLSFIMGIVEWGREHSVALAVAALCIVMLVCVIAAGLSLLAEAPSGGTSTAPLALSVGTLLATGAAILLLLGFDVPELEPTGVEVARSLAPAEADRSVTGADYERETGNGINYPNTPNAASAEIATPPGPRLLAALAPLSDVSGLQRAAVSLFTSDEAARGRALGLMNQTTDVLAANGQAETAEMIRGYMTRTGLA